MRATRKMAFDALELDLQRILKAPTDPKTVLLRVVAVLAAVVVGLLVFEYYLMAEKSQVARFLERRWEGGSAVVPDPDSVETVLDGAGHVRRRVVFQAPRRVHQQNIDWNKQRWKEMVGAKLPLERPQP